MNAEDLWPLLPLWAALKALTFLFRIWQSHRRRKAAKKDEKLVQHHREVKAALESEGTEFYPNGEKFCGIWQEATADLAKKDWKLEQQMRCWGVIWIACTRSIFDLALLYFAYQAYTADNLKILIVLGLWLVLRRLDLKAAGNTFAHELALDRLKMVSPDAEETYFTAKNWKHFEECKRRVEKFLTLEEQTQEQELAQPRRRNRDDELPWLEDRRKQTLRELGGR